MTTVYQADVRIISYGDDALNTTCPMCGSVPGLPCTTIPDREPTPSAHQLRWDAGSIAAAQRRAKRWECNP